jgi:hypothetical protein
LETEGVLTGQGRGHNREEVFQAALFLQTRVSLAKALLHPTALRLMRSLAPMYKHPTIFQKLTMCGIYCKFVFLLQVLKLLNV